MITDRKRRTGTKPQVSRRCKDETKLRLRKAKKEELRQMIRYDQSQFETGRHGDSAAAVAAQAINNNTTIESYMGVYNTWNADRSFVSTEKLVETTRGFRHLLASSKPPIVEAIKAGIIPFIVEFLASDHVPLKYEAVWAMTNITSSSETHAVANTGAVLHLVEMVFHDVSALRTQAAWCLGNIAGHSAEYRDALLTFRNGALIDGILMNLNSPENVPLLSTMAFTVSNLCRYKTDDDAPNYDVVKKFLKPLATLLQLVDDHEETCNNESLRVDICQTLCYLSGYGEDSVQAVLDANVVPLLVNTLKRFKKHSPVILPVVQTVGNIVYGSNQQTDVIIQAKFLKAAVHHFEHKNSEVQKALCWLMSNIAAGTEEHIDALFQTKPSCVGKLLQRADDSVHEIRTQAVWAICNIMTSGSDNHMHKLILFDWIKIINRCLKEMTNELRVMNAILDALDYLLATGLQNDCEYTLLMHEFGVVVTLEELQDHPNEKIYLKVVQILKTYLGAKFDKEISIAPDENENEYQFGLPKQLFPDESGKFRFDFGGEQIFNGKQFR